MSHRKLVSKIFVITAGVMLILTSIGSIFISFSPEVSVQTNTGTQQPAPTSGSLGTGTK